MQFCTNLFIFEFSDCKKLEPPWISVLAPSLSRNFVWLNATFSAISCSNLSTLTLVSVFLRAKTQWNISTIFLNWTMRPSNRWFHNPLKPNRIPFISLMANLSCITKQTTATTTPKTPITCDWDKSTNGLNWPKKSLTLLHLHRYFTTPQQYKEEYLIVHTFFLLKTSNKKTCFSSKIVMHNLDSYCKLIDKASQKPVKNNHKARPRFETTMMIGGTLKEKSRNL